MIKLAPVWTAKRKAAWLAVATGLFGAGEFAINAGIELPGSQHLPAWLRLAIIALVMVGASYFRWRSTKA